MRTQSITLGQMLAARDRRAEIQNELLGRQEGGCLVCLTLNIAGDVKRTPMTRMLFLRGTREFEALGLDVADSVFIDEATGSEAFWLLREDPEKVKRQLEMIEDSFPAARLFDFDVLAKEPVIRKLSRNISRKCLICERSAAECARSRSHGLDAVKAATRGLLREFCADELAEAAYRALLDEVYTTPKPGLVDLANQGAHTDMDVPLFEKSADSLRPYLHDAALMGMEGCSMKELRARGSAAETVMFEATGGVNTHKGMVYSMGLILAGAGRALAENGAGMADPDGRLAGTAAKYAAELARQDAEQLLRKALSVPETNGANVWKKYGAKGAVGEAAAGFPDAVYCASRLRYYRDRCTEKERPDSGDVPCRNIAGVLAFCDSMTRLEDTNLLHRGGTEGLSYVRSEAARIAGISDLGARVHELARLDGEMIRRNLSPGGSADMLALAFLLEELSRFLPSP